MSSAVFENRSFDFNVSLIKMKRGLDNETVRETVEEVVNLNAASTLSLILQESSLTMGARGSITVNSDLDILERLKITSSSPDDLYITIQISDEALNTTNIPPDQKILTLIGLITSTDSKSNSAVENAVKFDWEESFVAAVKNTQTRYFDGKGADLGLGQVFDDTNAVELCEAFNNSIYKNKSSDSIVAGSVTPNTQHTIEIQDKPNASVYDAIKKMVEESGVGTSDDSSVGKVPYFRFANAVDADNKVKRLLKFDAFLTDRHIEFVKAVKSGNVVGEFSDVYTEKFFLGPAADQAADDPNATTNNKVEKFVIERPDIGELREKIWGDYNISNAQPTVDPGLMTRANKKFSDIQVDFIERDLAGEDVEVNLPLLDSKELKNFNVNTNSESTSGIAQRSSQQIKQKVANKVIKSFITLNETIVFDVQGQVYRQPNKFIWIERGIEEENYKKLWYVNKIVHSFANGNYTTRISATKVFGDTSLESILANKIS